jgi:hypothetical protein
MRLKLCALGVAALLGMQARTTLATIVFSPLQTNMTALGLDNSTVEASESVPAGSAGYQQTGNSAGGNPNEASDSGGTATPGDQAIVEHYQATDFPASSFFDVFVEISIPPGPLGSFQTQIINPSGTTQQIGDAGFFLSPTEIPLDQLNETNYPDSSFTPIPSLDEFLGNGQTDSANVILPEPAALTLLACFGGLGLRRPKSKTH